MNRYSILGLLVLLNFLPAQIRAEALPDLYQVDQELVIPAVEDDQPAPGKRFKRVLSEYEGSDVYHVLYLPSDWKEGTQYPVIVEYTGNKYQTSPGTVEGGKLGYGISGGKSFIWVCLPYVSKNHKENEVHWWGDVEATVEYCKTVVSNVCRDYGGDPEALFLAGFSRGAIACNYIGLFDDEIAGLWRGFICHSHYDAVRTWNYEGSSRAAALVRLKRLGHRPQFISQEHSDSSTVQYLANVYPKGNFTFQVLPYRNHTDAWVLCDIAERKVLRDWVWNALHKVPQGGG